MGNMLTIARREIGSYFTSPMFWILAGGFLAFTGLIFTIYVLQSTQGGQAQANMGPLLGLQGTVFLFVTPLLAMRLLSEEQRSGTLELLMTSPVQDWQVVWGKWLGAVSVAVVILALPLIHVAIMSRLATNGMDAGPLLSNYIALFLLVSALLALGVLTSSVTDSQVVAGFLGVMLILVFWFLGLAERAGSGSVAHFFGYLGLSDHYLNFGEGTLDSRDLVYFVTLTIGALYLSTRILETRRWR